MKTPQQSHPGAIPPNSYYGGGNGHVSPHHISPHLMHPGMSGPQGPPPPSMMQHDSWGGPKMQVRRPLLLLPDKMKVLALLEGPYLKNKFVKQIAYESLTCKPSPSLHNCANFYRKGFDLSMLIQTISQKFRFEKGLIQFSIKKI